PTGEEAKDITKTRAKYQISIKLVYHRSTFIAYRRSLPSMYILNNE
ncbi:unnamed protein product, partial [Adineta steineri]